MLSCTPGPVRPDTAWRASRSPLTPPEPRPAPPGPALSQDRRSRSDRPCGWPRGRTVQPADRGRRRPTRTWRCTASPGSENQPRAGPRQSARPARAATGTARRCPHRPARTPPQAGPQPHTMPSRRGAHAHPSPRCARPGCTATGRRPRSVRHCHREPRGRRAGTAAPAPRPALHRRGPSRPAPRTRGIA